MSPARFEAWLDAPRRRPLVMGVLNVTPDSFSDGGRFEGPAGAERAADAALAMIDAGADLIDVGGESTRPGALPVAEGVQIERVVPVLRALRRRERERGQSETLISIDTTRSATASAALDAGARLINDVSAGRDDPAMLALAAARSAPIVLMHMQGTPATMQRDPHYDDVCAEVADFLRQRMASAVAAGVDRRRILLDPGIGFGKTDAHNFALLRRLGELVDLGRPILVGVSRKGFIRRALGPVASLAGRASAGRASDQRPGSGSASEDCASANRPSVSLAVEFGSAAAAAWSLGQGAAIVRVHDVAAMSQVTRIIEAIQSTGPDA